MGLSNSLQAGGQGARGHVEDGLREIEALCGEHLARISAAMEEVASPAPDPAEAQRRIRALRELHEVTAGVADDLERLLRSTAALDVSLKAKDALQGHLLCFDIQLRRISTRLRPSLVAVPSEGAGETTPTGRRHTES